MASARALGGSVPPSRGSYIGKGRGRGKLATKDGVGAAGPGDGTLPAPGYTAEKVSSQQPAATGVGRVLQIIETAASSITSQTLAEQVLKEAEASINTGDELTQLALSLHKWTLQAPERANITAIACNALGQMERDSVKFRSRILQLLKKDYDSRNDLMNRDETRLISLACFVCQFYKENSTVQGKRFQPLGEPALNCVQLLLESTSTKSQKCGVEQFWDLGPILYPTYPDKIDEIIDDLRRRLLASETSPASRVLFLEALEFYAGGWEMDDCAVEYYTNKKSGI